MPGRIPDNILEDILSRTDIVEVVSGFIPLKRAGRNFKALCPFHHEKTASFMVSPDRQIYHCFGCGESGNAFKFLMTYERLEFLEAVQTLAKKAGIVLPLAQGKIDKTEGFTTQLYKINELAAYFYANNLNSANGNKAKEYLLKRGLKEETIKLFQLGLAFDKWDALINSLRAKNYNLSLLEKSGLVIPKEGQGYYDRFRNRIIFPIFDIKSRTVGFGARVLDDSLPKYINSPETQIYTKGRNLYGLNLAKDNIRESDFVVVVEGYLDFIIPFQNGLKNIVASLGTALTTEQARVLNRYTHNVVMIYDADAAGELATLRSLDIFIEEGMNVKIACLPKGFDPDSFVHKFGIGVFKEKIEKAQDLFDYKLTILKSRCNWREIEGKIKVSQAMLETINKIKNSILRSEYIKRLAQELDIREDALLQEIKKLSQQKQYSVSNEIIHKKNLNINPTEQLLIKLMLEETELIEHIRKNLEPADFQDELAFRVVSIMFDLLEQGKNVEPATLMSYLEGEDALQLICESVFVPDNLSAQHKEKVINDCIKRLKTEKLKSKKHHLQNQITSAEQLGDEEKLNRLKEEFNYLIKQR